MGLSSLSRELFDHKQKKEDKYLSNYSTIPALWFDTHGSSTIVITGELQLRVELQYVNLVRIPFIGARNPHCPEYPLIHEILVGIPSSGDSVQ